MEQHNTDILVIGAGLTGLTTAFRLTREGKQVHILECSNRVKPCRLPANWKRPMKRPNAA